MKSQRVKTPVWQKKAFEGLRYVFFLFYGCFLAGLIYGVWYLKYAQPPEPVLKGRVVNSASVETEILPSHVTPEISPSPFREAVPSILESSSPQPEESHAV